MSCPSGGYSPSGEKPAAVVSDWEKRDWIQTMDFEPATDEDLALAHSPSYVSSIFNVETSNGHGNCDLGVAESTRWTVGSMVAAAAAAVQEKAITCSPSSGFHHAGYEINHGFCTFNGLIVAARRALAMPGVNRVAILDCDWHPGDGTQEIIDHLEIGNEVLHYSSGMHGPSSVPQYFDWLDESLGQIAQDDVGLILYQAGADAHKDDPLGGLLDNDELVERDRLVFDLYRNHHIPIAWNLAGGYQRDSDGGIEKVLAIHRATMHAAAQCLSLREIEPPLATASSANPKPLPPTKSRAVPPMKDLEARYGFAKQLSGLSDEQLVARFNQDVGNTGWGNARSYCLTCLRMEMERRSLDASVAIKDDGFSLAKRVKLVGDRLVIDSRTS